jgi:hypothetical protein
LGVGILCGIATYAATLTPEPDPVVEPVLRYGLLGLLPTGGATLGATLAEGTHMAELRDDSIGLDFGQMVVDRFCEAASMDPGGSLPVVVDARRPTLASEQPAATTPTLTFSVDYLSVKQGVMISRLPGVRSITSATLTDASGSVVWYAQYKYEPGPAADNPPTSTAPPLAGGFWGYGVESRDGLGRADIARHQRRDMCRAADSTARYFLRQLMR